MFEKRETNKALLFSNLSYAFSLIPKNRTVLNCPYDLSDNIFVHKKRRQLLTSVSLSAQEQIRTATPMRAPPPQDGASTNFATWAHIHLWYHKNKDFSLFYKSKIAFYSIILLNSY